MTEQPELSAELVGSHRLAGQLQLRKHLFRLATTGRLGHAYLFTGPEGSGKTALALAFAEAINGISNLGNAPLKPPSHRKSWYVHPDIHVFVPLPSQAGVNELRSKLELLARDPYELCDGAQPTDAETSDVQKPRASFYPVSYFNEHIRKTARLRASEGARNIIVITRVEKMRTEVVNAFLKMLEEPGQDVMFLLTTDNIHALLPTLVSRCQQLTCLPLEPDEIFQALVQHDGIEETQARYLSRVCNGNYSLARYQSTQDAGRQREEIVSFLRHAYSLDVGELLKITQLWHTRGKDNQLAITAMMATFLRDIALFRSGVDESLIINSDHIEVIRNFATRLQKARLEPMIAALDEIRSLLQQNVQARLVFTVLANRYTAWMRGMEPVVPANKLWMHMPAHIEPIG